MLSLLRSNGAYGAVTGHMGPLLPSIPYLEIDVESTMFIFMQGDGGCDVPPLGIGLFAFLLHISFLGFGWKRVAINSGPKNPKDLLKKRRVGCHKVPDWLSQSFEKVQLDREVWDKNDNLCNPLKPPSAENAISAIKLFAFPAKILTVEPVLPYILEEWISKNTPA
ncbi:hypothetical protein TNCV_501821 [Trichonephila clavipes]|nr:hypothetical protein TNCV_501821 [Trichonephila clavipes]